MFLDHSKELAKLYALGRFERGERDPLPAFIEYPKCAVIGTYKTYRPLKHACRHILELRMRIQHVGDLKQCICPARFLLLGYVEPRILIADCELACDRFKERNFLIEPLTRRM